MVPAASLTPYQRLEQAWVAYTRAPNEDMRRTAQDMIIALLKDQILGFTSSDAPRLRQLATSMEATPEFNKPVIAKVKALATQLELPFGRNLLLDDLWKLIISFISPAERNGINRSEKFFRALSQNASFLAQSINTGAHPISLAKLLPLLRICGSQVVELDLSRLLSEQDLLRLDATTLTQLIACCPNLQVLTLFGTFKIRSGELCEAIKPAANLVRLNVADCFEMREPASLDGIRKLFPKLIIRYYPITNSLSKLIKRRVRLESFLMQSEALQKEIVTSHEKICDLLKSGVSFRQYCALPTEKRKWVRQHRETIAIILASGMPFENLCRLPDQKQSCLVGNPDFLDKLQLVATFKLNVFAQLPHEEMEMMIAHTPSLIEILRRGMDFTTLCHLPLDSKSWILSKKAKRLIEASIAPERVLEIPPPLRKQFSQQATRLSLLLSAGVPWDLLLRMPYDIREMMLKNGLSLQGVSPQKLAQLPLEMLIQVFEEQSTLDQLLNVGMDFEVFCTITDDQRNRVINRSRFMKAFLHRGENLQTLLRLNDDEMQFIFNNSQAFSSRSIFRIPAFWRDKPLSKMILRAANGSSEVKNFFPDKDLFQSEDSLLIDMLEAEMHLRQLSQEDLAAQTKVEDITIINEGIPLAQFVALEEELRKKVLEKSAILGDKIRKGLKFEDFLALPTEEQDHILNSNN